MDESVVKNKMGTEPVKSLILKMSIPPLISMFMQYSYNLCDCMFVSWIDEKCLTAVSLVFPVTTLFLAIAIWVGVGVNVLIAKYLGENNGKRANDAVSNGILLSFAVGTLVTFVTLNTIKMFVASFTKDVRIFDLAIEYMQICSFMAIPCTVHICIQKILQGTGNMLAPMCFQIAGVLVNFIFDPILIFGYLGFPSMGIRGAAVATVMGYTFSTILAFLVLIFQKQKVKLSYRNFRPDFNIVYDIFAVGFPSFIMNALGAFMTFFTNSFLIVYSATAVAFFGAYFKIQQMVIMTLNGLIQGCIPIMSYNFGSGDEKRLKETLRLGTLIAVILTGISIILLWLFPGAILKAFNASDEMLAFGIAALRIMSTGYIFAGISTMIASYMQSVRKLADSMLINLLRQLLILFPMMYIGSRLFGLSGIWVSFLVSEAFTAIYSAAAYRRLK